MKQNLYDTIAKQWDENIIAQLMEYIKIPNKSPAFDAEWKAHGYMDAAMQLIVTWCRAQAIKDMTLEVMQLPGRTPLLWIDIPGQSSETIVLYGHMDKQPEMTGWDNDLGPWKPVLKGDKLYGRGGADDGYAVFAALTAIATLQKHQLPHARCIVLIEACEESGSPDFPAYLTHLKDRIGTPTLVIALDSGGGDYDRLWLTTSLRGALCGTLKVEVLKEGIHSGYGSGVVPSPMMILRQLLGRIEDEKTSEILLKALHVDIPPDRLTQAKETAACLGDRFYESYPFLAAVKTVSSDTTQLLLNRGWRPQLSVTGLDGLPTIANAGNVTIPSITVQLSMRLPPTADPTKAADALKTALEKDPPFNAKVTFSCKMTNPGSMTPSFAPWLLTATQKISRETFGQGAGYNAEGGSIPFISVLAVTYPQAQFLITGVLGPQSNAHGPNEFLHIPMAKKITTAVAAIIAAHYQQLH